MAVRLYVGQRDVPVGQAASACRRSQKNCAKKDRFRGLFVYKTNFFKASSTPNERSAVQI